MTLVVVVAARGRRIVPADVLEAATASDALNWYFPQLGAITEATALASDDVDAFRGQYLRETAIAADATNATLSTVFSRGVVEAVNALDSVGGVLPHTVPASLSEAASAADAVNGSVAPPTLVPTTWSTTDLDTMTISGGNLTATSSGSIAGVRAANGLSSGKYYYEIRISTWANTATGMSLANMTATVYVSPGGAKAVGFGKGGAINVNGSGSGSTLGPRAAGDILGVAVDITNALIWFRVAPSGNWNGSGTANPATGSGGISFSAITGTMAPQFYAQVAAEVATANFGASAFSGAVPAGFTAGFPVP